MPNITDGIANAIDNTNRSNTVDRDMLGCGAACSKSKPQSHNAVSDGLNIPHFGHSRAINLRVRKSG